MLPLFPKSYDEVLELLGRIADRVELSLYALDVLLLDFN